MLWMLPVITSLLTLALTIPSVGIYGADVVRCPLAHYRSVQKCIDDYDITLAPDRMLILGHDTRTLGKMHKVKKGDLIAFNRQKYEVSDIRIVNERAVHMLEKPADLILQTCWRNRRMLVYAILQ